MAELRFYCYFWECIAMVTKSKLFDTFVSEITDWQTKMFGSLNSALNHTEIYFWQFKIRMFRESRFGTRGGRRFELDFLTFQVPTSDRHIQLLEKQTF